MNTLPGRTDLPPGVSMFDIDPPVRCHICWSDDVLYRSGQLSWCADCVPVNLLDGPNINEDGDDDR